MFPPLIRILSASTPVKARFGTTPLRVYPFGGAPAKGETGYAVPYAVWQTVIGDPENYLGGLPDLDAWRVQVDVYATTFDAAAADAKLIRDAVEPVAYIASFNGSGWDEPTGLFRYSFDCSFQTPR